MSEFLLFKNSKNKFLNNQRKNPLIMWIEAIEISFEFVIIKKVKFFLVCSFFFQ